jgi:hypothetical protein
MVCSTKKIRPMCIEVQERVAMLEGVDVGAPQLVLNKQKIVIKKYNSQLWGASKRFGFL